MRHGAKLIGTPDSSFHGERRIFWRSCTTEPKTSRFSRSNRSGSWKEIRRSQWNDQCENCDAEQNLTINRIDKFLRDSLVTKEPGRRKEIFQKIFSKNGCFPSHPVPSTATKPSFLGAAFCDK